MRIPPDQRPVMHLFTLLLLLGGLFVSAPPAHAQRPAGEDSLTVSETAQRPAPAFSTPFRRCRDEIKRRVASPAVAQARCSGAFGAPSVPAGQRADLVDAGLHARMLSAVAAALNDRRDIGG